VNLVSNPLRLHLYLIDIFQILLFVPFDAFPYRNSEWLRLILKVLIVALPVTARVAHFCCFALLVHQNHLLEHSLLLSLIESDYVLNFKLFIFLGFAHFQNLVLLRTRKIYNLWKLHLFIV